MVVKFIKHLRPRYIDKNALNFSLTFGLGGLLVFLFLILTVTGIVLMLFYIPSVDCAYLNVKKISNIIPFMGIVRDMHRISGELMVVVGFLHMSRVVFVKAFDNLARIHNWQTGVLLFLLIFPLNFTGYLLPWDSTSYWGATIVLNLINSVPFVGESFRILISGENGISASTLIRFYTYHVVVLPAVFSVLMMNHFYLIRRSGGVKRKNNIASGEKININELYKTEILYALFVTIILFCFVSFFYNAPLLEDANNGIIPSIIRAPWYFAAIQFLLTFFPPIFAGIFLPVLYSVFLFFFYKIKNVILFISVHFLIIIFTILEFFVK